MMTSGFLSGSIKEKNEKINNNKEYIFNNLSFLEKNNK